MRRTGHTGLYIRTLSTSETLYRQRDCLRSFSADFFLFFDMPERAANRGSLTKTVAEKHESQNSVQLKTFTRWANSYLEPRGEPVTDLVAQVNSGVLFFRLLEALEVLPVAPVARGKFSAFGYKVISAPTLKLQRLENLNSFLLVLAGQKSLSLVNIGARQQPQERSPPIVVSR